MLSEKPWNLEQVLIMLMGMIACIFGFNLLRDIVLHFSGPGKLDENSPLYLILFTLNIHGSILVGTGLFLWWHRLSLGSAFGIRPSRTSRALLFGLPTGILFLPVGNLLREISIQIMTRFGLGMPKQGAVLVLEHATTVFSRVYLSAFTIVLAPVAEEILFRGILYATIKQCGYPRAALWCSAIAFSAMHGNLPIFLPLTLLGLIFALLYERTDNLLTPIIAHATFNAINVAGLYFMDRGPGPV
ncbi:MAG: abortive infection protein [Pedosphaera sp.]|nr:abortive infection protein [Pedosphaera sp.]